MRGIDVKQLRGELTQRELAELVGISERQIARIESAGEKLIETHPATHRRLMQLWRLVRTSKIEKGEK